MTDNQQLEAAPSERVFVVGTSGTGKSFRAWSMYLSRMPRRIIVDNTGEWSDKADAIAETIPEAVDAIRALARKQPQWTVTLPASPAEMQEFVDWLIPLPQLHKSPIRALGGAAMLVDEVDLIAPPRVVPDEIRTLYRRSRHVGLTLVSATQRPAAVSREVSAMSTQAIMLSLSEPRDVRYMQEVFSLSSQHLQTWQRWTHRHHHGGLWWHRQTGHLRLIPNQGPMSQLRNPAAQTDAFDASPVQPQEDQPPQADQIPVPLES